MTTKFSGTYIGAAGTHSTVAKPGLKLTSDTANYILTGTAIAIGGAGYGFVGLGGAGGAGVKLTTGGTLTNKGNVTGGEGGQGGTSFSGNGSGGAGGDGILFVAKGTLLNHGTITGGNGGGGGTGIGNGSGNGGIGVDFTARGQVTNAGLITGGSAGTYGQSIDDGIGGDGIYFGGVSTLDNSGTITGGGGGFDVSPIFNSGDGGAGVVLAKGGLIINTGLISGGNGGSAFDNINHGFGARDSNAGGAGIDLVKGGIVLNTGTVTGGLGGGGLYSDEFLSGAGNGGIGIDAASGGTIANLGTISGGQAGAAGGEFSSNNFGGVGVTLTNGIFLNLGKISGGYGGFSAGNGGDAVQITGGTYPGVNFGLIAGGNGGVADDLSGTGGDGVVLTEAGVFINLGTITGGTGAFVTDSSRTGTGIDLAGGSTLLDTGAIKSGFGAAGNAVYFDGDGSSRLIINPTAMFDGAVTALGTNNVLELTGTAGNLFEEADDIHGFQTLQIDANASWTVAGTFATVLLNHGTASIASGTSLDVTSAVDPASTGVFELTGKASLEIASLLGSHVQIEFLGGTPKNLLTIDDPAKFGLHVGTAAYTGPLLEDFKAGNTIDLKDIGSSGLKFDYSASTGDLQITASGGGVVASLQFQNASLGAGSFHLVTDKAGGSLLTHS